MEYVKMIENGRISLYDYVMHFNLHLMKKRVKWLITK